MHCTNDLIESGIITNELQDGGMIDGLDGGIIDNKLVDPGI